MGKAYQRKDEDFKKYHVKVYDADELEALNIYLRQRDNLPPEVTSDSLVVADFSNEHFISTIYLGRNYYIGRDENEIDWMIKKKNGFYKRMFRLESWKRFNWGKKEKNHGSNQSFTK